MAKQEKFELDDYGFEKELDFEDVDFDITPPKDDRKPVTKAASGFFKGAKDTAFSNQFVKKFIKDALPKGYGDTMEMVGEGMGEASKLYNSTAQEIKPTIKELKKVAGRAMPHIEGKVPKGLAEKLKKWTASAEDGASAQDYRESAITSQLGQIFQEQVKEADKSRQQDEVKDAIRENITEKRHTDIFDQLEGIRVATTRLSSYQDSVAVNYHRKSLELQYRQYYVAADLLEEQKKSNEQFKSSFAEIVKNTGLPEYVKLQNTERLGDMMRNKFMSNVYDTVFDKRRGYLGKAVNRLGTQIKDKVVGFAGDVQNGISAAEMGLDMAENAQEMGMPGMDPYEMGGSMAGSMAADSIGQKIGKKVGSFIETSPHARQVRAFGNDLEYGVKNISQLGDKFSRGDYDYDDGVMGKIISTLSKMPGGDAVLDALKDAAYTGRPDQTFKVDAIKDMQAPAIFSNQTRKSINEVIPGFLSRIYQELQIIRTGDSNIGLTQYDFGGNKFSGEKALLGSAMSRIVDKDQQERFQRDNDELIKQIDPEDKLSKEERAELGKFFLHDNLNNGLADPKRFADQSQLTGLAPEIAKKVAELFSTSFGIDDFGEIEDKEKFSSKRVKFSNAYGNLGSGFGDSRGMIQEMINLGYHDIIRQSGLMNEKGQFNQKALHDLMANGIPSTTLPEPTQLSPSGLNPVNLNPVPMPVPTPAIQPQITADAAVNNGFDQTRFDEFSGGSLDIQKQILDAINNTNDVEYTESIAKTTTRIEAILLDSTFRDPKSNKSMSDGEKRRWYQANIGDMIGGTMSGIGTGLKFIGKQLDKAASKTLALGTGIVDTGFSAVKGGAKWLMNKRDEYVDMYVKGETSPRIQAWRLKAGHYIDQKSGKVIKKLSDIKGAVIDKDGNMVLSLEDMKNLVSPDVRSRLKKAVDGVIGLGKKGLENMLAGYSGAIGMTKSVFKFAKSSFMKALARDVYVKGEENPKLLAITMRVGGYRSKYTGKVIWRPIQIDGPVVNSDGEVVLSEDDLQKGIVDANGKPFKTILSRAFSFGKKVITGTLGTLNKGAKWVANKAMDSVDIVTQFIKNGLGVEGGGFGFGYKERAKTSKEMVDRLTEIRDLLDARLPGKKVAGDVDGDGLREGSWQALSKARQEKDEEKEKEEKEAKRESKSGLGITSGLSALMAKFKKKDEDEEDDDDGIDLLDVAAAKELTGIGNGDSDSGDGKKKKKGRKKGKFGRMWNGAKKFGGKALKFGAKGLGVAGAAYGAYSAYDNIQKGNYGEAALDAGLAVGGTALTVGAGGAAAAGTGILAGLGTALGAAGTGIAAVLGTPVVLGALAIGAGYLAYRYFTKKKLEPLSTYRYAQYGFTVKDTQHLEKIFGLEGLLIKSVQYGQNGASLKDDIPLKDMLEVMGINPTDKKLVYRFTQWLQYRFKPVFLTHLSVLKTVAPNVSLGEVDSKLKPEEKLRYFNASKFPDGPYGVFASPVDDRNQLTVSSLEVTEAAKICEAALKKEMSGDKNKAGVDEGKTASAVAGAAALATEGGNKGPAVDDSGKALDDFKSQDGIKATAVNALKRTLGVGSETGLGFSMPAEVINDEKQISPLNAIRYRTYGLYDLEVPKINALLTLEQGVLEEMRFTGKEIVWEGDIDKIIRKCGSKFGVSDYNTRQGENFAVWFNSRFLPVFYNYAGTIYQLTGKKNVREASKILTPSQQLAVANAVYTTKTSYNGRSNVSVWSVPESPWADYVVNTNEATVHDSVKALNEKAKDDVGAEKIPSKKADALTQPSLDSDKNKQQAQQNSSLWESAKDSFAKAGNWVSEKAGQAWQAVKDVGSGISDGVSRVAGKAREYAGNVYQAAGTAVSSVAAGVGGLLNDIPMPTMSGSWAALKDTISAASKMVGVDEKLMAIMAAIESGFNYTVKAGTSSAKGLYQFIDSTWKMMVSKYGAKYGINPSTPVTDPRANAILGAEFLKMNMERIAPVLGRAPTYTDMYLAHFMGDGGARKFLRAMKENPNAVGAQIFSKEARANPQIFTDRATGQPRTLQEIYNHFTSMINKKAKSFKIDTVGGTQPAANDPQNPATATTDTSSQSTAAATPSVATPSDASSTTPSAMSDATPSAETKPGGAVAAAVTQPATSKTAEMIANDSKNKAPVSTTASTVPESAGPIQAGFSQMPMRQVAIQQETSKEDFTKSIGVLDKTLLESLEVQRSSLKVLEGILEAVKSGAVKMPNAAETPKGGVVKTNAQMPNAPVSMRKSA